MTLSRQAREQLKSLLHRLFVGGQKLGWDILPRHFYSSIPSIQELKNTESWTHPFDMSFVGGADIASQMAFVMSCCTPPLRERMKSLAIYDRACTENGEPGYGAVEADFLFCFIVTRCPKKIVQVGSGVSTAVIQAAAREADYKPKVICIEPFPTDYLTRSAASRNIELIVKRAEDTDSRILTDLSAGDLLFVDSTHALRPGSEVNWIILQILPHLPAGSFVHFHDIYFPYDYQPTVLSTLFFSGESSLLHAFLLFNQKFSIAASLSMLHHACPDELQALLPSYRPAVMNYGLLRDGGEGGQFPSSTYLAVQTAT